MVTVVLYSKENVKICEVLDLKSNSVKNVNKRSNRFDVRTLAYSKRLILAILGSIIAKSVVKH